MIILIRHVICEHVHENLLLVQLRVLILILSDVLAKGLPFLRYLLSQADLTRLYDGGLIGYLGLVHL